MAPTMWGERSDPEHLTLVVTGSSAAGGGTWEQGAVPSLAYGAPGQRGGDGAGRGRPVSAPPGHIQTVKGPLTVTPLHGLGHLLAPLSLGEGLDRAQHYGEN